MPWEKRAGTPNRYYYRTVRRGGRFVREYLGCGAMAQAVAAGVEHRQQQRKETRQTREALTREWQATQTPLIDLCGLVDLAAHAALTTAGFHRPKRGIWRKRRHADIDPGNGSSDPGPAGS